MNKIFEDILDDLEARLTISSDDVINKNSLWTSPSDMEDDLDPDNYDVTFDACFKFYSFDDSKIEDLKLSLADKFSHLLNSCREISEFSKFFIEKQCANQYIFICAIKFADKERLTAMKFLGLVVKIFNALESYCYGTTKLTILLEFFYAANFVPNFWRRAPMQFNIFSSMTGQAAVDYNLRTKGVDMTDFVNCFLTENNLIKTYDNWLSFEFRKKFKVLN